MILLEGNISFEGNRMKKENLIYGLGSVLIITGAVMKIYHVAYGEALFSFSLIAMIFFQTWYVTSLKKTIKDLESKL